MSMKSIILRTVLALATPAVAQAEDMCKINMESSVCYTDPKGVLHCDTEVVQVEVPCSVAKEFAK